MNNHVIIIAEAGVNHNGSLELAKKLVEEAADAGVDYIKFQTFKSEGSVSKYAPKAEYQISNTGTTESQIDMLKKLELPYEAFVELYSFCKSKGIGFLSSSTDKESVEFLRTLNMDFWKIPSGEVTNYLYLKKVASFNMPTLFSTGMSTMEEVSQAIKVLLENGIEKKNLIILHCNTEYPTPFTDVNLRAMQAMHDEFKLQIGYSDHTTGIEVPIAAVAMGATVIEKHFTLDRKLQGPDHKASLEPQELKAMVRAIRNIEQALGDGEKHVSESERKNIAIARKSIVASRDIRQGEILTEDNLMVKRPGTGISPMRWNDVLGKKAIRNFKEDEIIEL